MGDRECQCGCGRQTAIATKTSRRYGHVKGQPLSYLSGHSKRRPALPIATRYWSKVKADAEQGASGCWVWLARTNKDGYGFFSVSPGVTEYAHRMAWILINGPLQPGLCVLHHCDNPPCCRPSHLFLGTPADNTQDMMQKGRNKTRHGEANGFARLTASDALAIRGLCLSKSGGTQAEIALRFGVTEDTVNRINRGRTWRHLWTGHPVDFSRISGQAGGVAYVPDECKPKDETGSPDDMWIRVKVTERLIPEENSGFADHRPLGGSSGYDMYGYTG